MKVLVLVAILSFLPFRAEAGESAVASVACYPADTGGATKEGPNLEAGATVPTVRIDFPDAADTTAYCLFHYPLDAPYRGGCTGASAPWACCTGADAGCDSTTNVFEFDATRYSSTNVGNVVWDIDVCASGSGSAAGSFVCSSEAEFTDTAITTTEVTTEDFAVGLGAAAAILDPRGRQALLRIRRVGTAGGDSETGTATFTWGRLRYEPNI